MSAPARRLVPLMLLTSLFLTATTWGNPALFVPKQVVRGDAFSVVIHSTDPVGSMAAKLVSPSGGVVADAPGFRIQLARDVFVWAALLAVDSTAEPGGYRLQADFESNGSRVAVESPLTVVDRTFARDTIRLNESLTDLRATPDPRKVAQARLLLGILARRDPGAQYLFSPLRMPVQNAIETSHYGDRRLFRYSDGEDARAIHYGLDLALPVGTPIESDGDGVVVFTGELLVSGNTVVVEHLPGVFSLYYHMNRIDVSTGQRISAGNVLGTVGMTGLATGPHLHWEVRVDGVPVDPRSLLAGPLIDKAGILNTIVNGSGSSVGTEPTAQQEGR